MSFFTAVGLICLSLLTISCRPLPDPPPTLTITPAPDVLQIGVVDSAAPFADLVVEPYTATTDRVIVHFVVGNTETLVADLANGQLDALLLHTIPTENENWFNPVALDGLAILTHPDNSVETLSLAEVQAIFNGRITTWQSVAGSDLPITLISRERGSGTRFEFEQRIMAEQRISINAQVVADNETMIEVIEQTPGSIGYSMMGGTAEAQVMTIDGRLPTSTTTADQSYPLTVPLYFLHNSPAEPQGELRAFLAWLQSDAGQEIIGQRYGRVK